MISPQPAPGPELLPREGIAPLPVEVPRSPAPDEAPAPRPGRRHRLLAPTLAALVALLVGWPALFQPDVEGLDQAHHLMDGLFFADLFRDLPLEQLASYPFDYYARYPALGFTFWPPFFPFIEGLFLTAGGMEVAAARASLLAFGLLLAALMAVCLRKQAGATFAFLAAALAVTAPLLAEHYNTIMLEVPVLAMAFLTIALYQRVVDRGRWKGPGEVVLLATVAAATVYTKQPIVFLFAAMLVDLGVNHPAMLRARATWVAAALFVLLCIPLALFTLKYGTANLAQSFGSRGDIFVSAYKAPPRWSVAGWTWYAGEMLERCLPLMIPAVAALLYGLVRREFLRRHALWVAWVAGWYLLFSLFDNKQPRFLTFAIPGVAMLAGGFAAELARNRPRAGAALAGAFTALILAQTLTWSRAEPYGFTGMREAVVRLLEHSPPGNLAYFGDHRQLFVPYVRLEDPDRQRFVLQGDDILRVSPSLAQACHDFQVRWILLEASSEGARAAGEDRELAGEAIRLVREEPFGSPRQQKRLRIYEYTGPVAATMKAVPLRSNVQQIARH